MKKVLKQRIMKHFKVQKEKKYKNAFFKCGLLGLNNKEVKNNNFV